MNILVLAKRTFDTEEKIVIEDGRIAEDGAEFIINPYDEYAVEEGIRLREEFGGEVTVLCVGPPEADKELRTALAMGADKAIFVENDELDEDEESPLQASQSSILRSEIGPNEIHLYDAEEQHANWVRCIKNRRATIAPPEVAHRSCTACLVSHIAMKMPGKLYWDPVNERFKNNDKANSMLSRPQRHPYKISQIPGLVAR
jgi:hypothetical protein